MACGCWGWGGGCVTRAKLQRPNKMFLLIFNQVLKVFHCNEHLHPIIRKINANGSELAHNLPVAPKSIASVNTLWVPQSRVSHHVRFKFSIFCYCKKFEYIFFSFFFKNKNKKWLTLALIQVMLGASGDDNLTYTSDVASQNHKQYWAPLIETKTWHLATVTGRIRPH